jgi:hypothetical protein
MAYCSWVVIISPIEHDTIFGNKEEDFAPQRRKERKEEKKEKEREEEEKEI